jgi:hypothetical protein
LTSMPDKLNKAAEVLGDAVGTIETAAAAAGSRIRQGLGEGGNAVADSKTGQRLKKRSRPARKAAGKKAKSIKKTAKKRAGVAKRKATGAKKTAKKRAGVAKRKATKKTAKKRS